ncbi:uncharacterized protein LOC121267913 [Juglans microcarpa x Juglans regia]|uniref:uncharacterized protein LOC121267913 n=1 Tax=Juglans microcarpa x Juglans regia TaxID=2249226 RepID=UPI001B7DA798|nr:uncharacterized protein LOC121267913 [Juglans microcarpa x Juglans regia]
MADVIEAYVKALGKGFSAAPFKTFTIRFRTAAMERGIRLPGHSDSEIVNIGVDTFDDPKAICAFSLLELTHSHYAAIYIEKDRRRTGGKGTLPMKLTVRRTIPHVEDECVSGTEAVVAIGGLTSLSDPGF